MKTEKKKLKIGVAAVLILAFFMAIIFFIVKIFFLQSAEPELNPVAAKLILSKDKTSVVGVENREEATYVEIPNEVTSIGYAVFAGCKKLTSISIPNGVERIGNYAFSRCWGLRSITIPKSVIHIEDDVFYGCYVTKENFKNESKAEASGLTIIDTDKDGFCIKGNKLCRYRSNRTETNIQIPNSVTSIGEGAFGRVDNVNYSGSASGAPWGAVALNGVEQKG